MLQTPCQKALSVKYCRISKAIPAATATDIDVPDNSKVSQVELAVEDTEVVEEGEGEEPPAAAETIFIPGVTSKGTKRPSLRSPLELKLVTESNLHVIEVGCVK